MSVRLAIPNRGRLMTECHRLLRSCGILPVHTEGDRRLFWEAHDERLEVFALRSTDIPRHLVHDTVQFGITGRDYLLEARADEAPELLDLGLAHGWLCVLAPRGQRLDLPRDLDGKRVATKYVNLLSDLMSRHGVAPAEVVRVDGAAEVYCRLGLADLVFDIVCTGATAKANGLKPMARAVQTSAHLYASPATPSRSPQLAQDLVRGLRDALHLLTPVEEYPWETIETVLCWR